LESPGAGRRLNEQAGLLSDSPERIVDPPGLDVRLFALPVLDGTKRVGTVVTGVSLAPYRETQRTTLADSIGLAAALLLIVGLALGLERDSGEYRQTREAIRRDADQLSRALETLVAAARQEGGPPRGTADAYSAVEAAIGGCGALAGDGGVEVVLERPSAPI